MSEQPTIPPILTVAALAERWGTSTTFVYNLLYSGSLEGFRLGGKIWRIKAEAVLAFEAAGGV